MDIRNTQISIFKDLFKSTDVPYIVPLWKSIERIRQGKSKNLIEDIRQGNKEIKKRLPSILFAGEFTERNSRSLKQHSGLMILDFDKYPSNEVMMEHLEKLKENNHFVTLFISPSGNGIKAVLRVPNSLTKETHPQYFKAFQKEYDYKYFDISNSNVDRVCFESYDPDIYINYEAEIYSPIIKDEGFDRVERAPIIPISNEDIIIDKIMEWDWKKDFVDGERNSFIFDISGAFCEYGVTQTMAEGYILNNVVSGEFSERESLTAIKSAYRTRTFNSKYFEDYNRIERIRKDLNKGKDEVLKIHKINEESYEIIKEEKSHDDFWYFEKKKPKIDPLKYKWFLERSGFKKYFPFGAQKPIWVKIQSNIVSETSVEKIKDYVLDFLLDRNEFDVWRYCSNYGNIFSENFLLMLESIELEILRDQKDTSFIAFKNGILKIKKDSAKLEEYVDVEGYIWNSQIINRNFQNQKSKDNDYRQFIINITHNEPLPMECAIGYLLSGYKNKMNNKAIILNDEEISNNPEGGTGKGLFVQGIRQIRKVSILDGKSFDDKKNFAYQTVTPDTHVLVFDDVKKNFDFESKFSLVTEGITIERKNKDALKLSVEDSPKMLISTNYAIKGEGNSHDRRRHELEIAQFYGKKLTPYDDFKRNLFDDWSDDDFRAFDNYMVYCLQCYLTHGLIQQHNAKNLKKRKFIIETSMEFMQWVNDGQEFDRTSKAEAFENFTNEYPDFKKWLNRKTFNIWVQKWASFSDSEYLDGNTNGIRWFSVITKDMEVKELEEVEHIPF